MSNQKCRFCLKVNPPGSRFCNFCGNDLAFAIQPNGLLPSGAVLRGSYVIEEEIGDGGMGTVYSCHHKTLGTRYALKVLDPKLARMDILRKRFLAEAKIQAKVVHPHIVHVMDVLDGDKDGGIPGVLAIVMEYIEGEALDQIIERAPLSERDTVSCALVMLDAIGFAHHAGIVHRDIKPSNIMISAEESKEALYCGVKVMDFGIAKLLQENEQRTVTGTKLGTPKYMAPEQIENARDVDERADLYAIGLTMYEMLCGRTPFEEYREFELMKAQLTMKPPSMRKWRNDISDRLEAIIMKALEKDRANRYPNAESFQRALLSLGGYDDIKLLLNPYEGTTILPTNQKLQRKIERAIDRTRSKNQDGEEPQKSVKPRIDKKRKTEAPLHSAQKSIAESNNSAPQQSADQHETRAKDAAAHTESAIPKKSPTHPSIIQISREKKRTNPDAKSKVVFKRGRTIHDIGYAKTEIKNDTNDQTADKLSSAAKLQSIQKSAEKLQPVKKVQSAEKLLKSKREDNSSKAQEAPKNTEEKKSVAVQSNTKPKQETAADTNNLSDAPKKSQQQAAAVAQKKHTALKLVLIVICILAAAGLYYRHSNHMPIPGPEEQPETTAAEQKDTILNAHPIREIQTDYGMMTSIPAAKHWVSTDKSDELKMIQLPAFSIDQTEVSYYQYNKCIEAGKCPPLANVPEDVTLPVTGIGYGSADEFCKFAGKSLPTADQWEAAARYGGETNGITFVNVSCDTIHFGAGRGECKKINPNAPENVFRRMQSANPGHILNMLGNVREWTSTPDPQDPQKYITKGGSYQSGRSEINISVNVPMPVNSGAPDLGFRCVKND